MRTVSGMLHQIRHTQEMSIALLRWMDHVNRSSNY